MVQSWVPQGPCPALRELPKNPQTSLQLLLCFASVLLEAALSGLFAAFYADGTSFRKVF
jgi:hypothetical protein